MRFDLLTIPIAITTFVASPEPISVLKSLQTSVEDFWKAGLEKKFTYFAPIKTNPLLDIQNKIFSFKTLPDNWDGMGAIAPNASTINNSISFLYSLPESTYESLNQDNIVATPYGTIVLDIERNSNLVSVEVGETKVGFFTDFVDGCNPPPLESATLTPNRLPLELYSALNKLFLLEEAEACA